MAGVLQPGLDQRDAVKHGFTVERCKISPCLYRVKESGLVLNLYVYDGLGAAPRGYAKPFLKWLSTHLDLKSVSDLTVGDSFEYLKSTKTIDADGIT